MTPLKNSEKRSAADIVDWRPEDESFWESTGKRIAYRNLWISVPALLCVHAAPHCTANVEQTRL